MKSITPLYEVNQEKEKIMDIVRDAFADFAYKNNIAEPDKFFYEAIEKKVRDVVFEILDSHQVEEEEYVYKEYKEDEE